LWAHALHIGGRLAGVPAWGCAALLCAGGLMVAFGRGVLGSALLGTGGVVYFATALRPTR
jgi:hypothetical protein